MMRRMQEDMDRLFGQFFGGPGTFALAPDFAGEWSPSMDISESGREWCVEAELPGVNREDIEVEVRDRHLILRAEMRQPAGEEPAGGARRYHRQERRYGYFERVLPLPENVNEEAVRCEFRTGVLAIHLPKTEQAQREPRRIPIADVEQIPSETASGRMRSKAELAMSEGAAGGNGKKRAAATAGAKGGEASTRSPRRQAKAGGRPGKAEG
jgi:HSP20 family protein